jgi:hypothetical protein
VRVQAAAMLGRMRDPRATRSLSSAAVSDPDPLVRGFCLRLLAKNPGTDPMGKLAEAAIRRGLSDRDPKVRADAEVALGEWQRAVGRPAAARPPARTAALQVAVREVGDRTGRAPPALREHMRAAIEGHLRSSSSVRVAAPTAPDAAFVVDASIKRLDTQSHGPDMEAVCAVDLIVSRPPRGIVLIASGEALVQKPRVQFRPIMRAQMEEEALDHAVKTAHENLSRFLAEQ